MDLVTPTAPNASRIANVPARQSASFQPPKSRSVAATPPAAAITIAIISSGIQRAVRRIGMILAQTKAATPAATHSAAPIGPEVSMEIARVR